MLVDRSPGLPLIECQCHLVSPHSSCYINFFPFPPLFCFVSSCLTGLLTIVYQVSPMWGPWGQAFSLIACLPPACSLGSPLSTFQTTLIITPLGPACSRHLRSLAGRFVSPPSAPPLLSLLASVLTSFCPTNLTLIIPSPLPFTLCLLPHNASPQVNPHRESQSGRQLRDRQVHQELRLERLRY